LLANDEIFLKIQKRQTLLQPVFPDSVYSGLHKYVPIEKPFLFSVSINDLGQVDPLARWPVRQVFRSYRQTGVQANRPTYRLWV
jgi:hypothetical protein